MSGWWCGCWRLGCAHIGSATSTVSLRSGRACSPLAYRTCGLPDYTGRILEWISVGQPDERALGKAASQADQVLLFPFAAGVATWWRTVGPKVAELPNLSVVQIPHAPVQQLAQSVDRRVSAQVMVMEGQVTMTVGVVDVTFTPEPLR